MGQHLVRCRDLRARLSSYTWLHLHDGLGHGIYATTGGRGTVESCELTGNALAALFIEVSSGHVDVRDCRVDESRAAQRRIQSEPPPTPLAPAQVRRRVVRLRDDAEQAARLVTDTGTFLQVRPSLTDRIDGVAHAEETSASAAAMAGVALALASNDPERAEHLSRTITNQAGRAQAVANLANTPAPADQDRAERLARSVTAKHLQAWALCQVAVAVAAADPARAERLARSVTGPREQAWALARGRYMKCPGQGPAAAWLAVAGVQEPVLGERRQGRPGAQPCVQCLDERAGIVPGPGECPAGAEQQASAD